jgi:ATP-binding protein involved in chromosome partitioning
MRALVEARIPLVGVIENMAGYACGACGDEGPLFAGDAGAALAAAFDVPLLARVPFDLRARPAEPGPRWTDIVDRIRERLP